MKILIDTHIFSNKCHIMTDDKKFSLYECRLL